MLEQRGPLGAQIECAGRVADLTAVGFHGVVVGGVAKEAVSRRSPWANVRSKLAGIDAACFDAEPMRIEPLRLPFDLTLALPGSKSEAQRIILSACLADGRTTLRDATPSDDVRTLVTNLAAMGFRIAWFDEAEGILTIDGGLPDAARTAHLDCGLGGVPLRFLLALAAAIPGDWTLTGSPRLLERPLEPLVDALRELGARIESAPDRSLRVRGGGLRGGELGLDASASSQFLSALLLIAPRLPDGLAITLSAALASPSYAELTVGTLRRFGIETGRDGPRWCVPEGPGRSPGDLRVEGDWSAAGAFFVLARLTRSRFRGTNLRLDSAQGDRLLPLHLEALAAPGDVEIDLSDLPDQAPNLVVAALLRNGETRFVGGAGLRGKESDRIAALVTELARTGADLDGTADGFRVRGGRPLHGAALACHDDHRLAMAFAILGSLVPGVEIDSPACVAKSHPAFFAQLQGARHSPRCIALVGMRGVGKSTLAPLLAHDLGLECVDTDLVFEREHGPIRRFVEREGWPAFRAHEAAIVTQSAGPGRVLAVGGGAIETPGCSRVLQDRALVIWLQEDETTLVERLHRGDRPALGTTPLEDEVRTTAARRAPLYAGLAGFVLGPGGSLDERRIQASAWLRSPWQAHAGPPVTSDEHGRQLLR
jgi:3-phosphoshikimate 1-carboxyvinyltransferase